MAKVIIKRVILILLFTCFAKISAQSNTGISQQDTSVSKQIISLKDTTLFQMKKSAWGAVLRSAVLPGFGQFYNESYWKIPVVWGFLGYFAYQWNSNNNSYKRYRDLYSASVDSDKKGNDTYYTYREFYRDQRDMFAVYIGLTYFLNLVDAFVDAHLFDFDVSNDGVANNLKLSMRIGF